mgnify:CR=1 FL=1
MKFLCKLFGCNDSKTVVKEVPVEVIKEVPVEIVKKVHTSVEQQYPQKPERPVPTGTLEGQLNQIYDHYGLNAPAQAFVNGMGSALTPEYIELVIELIDVINEKTLEYMNRLAYEDEVIPALAMPSTDMLRRTIEERKNRARINYIVDAVRNDLPICGCKAAQQ